MVLSVFGCVFLGLLPFDFSLILGCWFLFLAFQVSGTIFYKQLYYSGTISLVASSSFSLFVSKGVCC